MPGPQGVGGGFRRCEGVRSLERHELAKSIEPQPPRLAAHGCAPGRQRSGDRAGRSARLALPEQELHVPAVGTPGQLPLHRDTGRRRESALERARAAVAGPRDLGGPAQRADRALDSRPVRRTHAARARGAAVGPARGLGPRGDHASVPPATPAQRSAKPDAAALRQQRAPRQSRRTLAASPRAPAPAVRRGAGRWTERAVSVRCGFRRAARS